MRHWLQFWQLRTWIHDNLCNLTINYDNEQHSQFLRCLTLTSHLLKGMPSNFLLTFHINTNFKRQSHNYPKFPKVKTHNNFWKQILTRRINLFCWNFGDLITITTTIKILITITCTVALTILSGCDNFVDSNKNRILPMPICNTFATFATFADL